ncbi:MAG TPA: bifunctional 5,10-methylenetetrahydrofolate dehydrogenase/5,10-methenyltetrahydrofolate cyclohydrolase [Candidatus Saccharimonadales bacterium]|nr:bifunctional 5,10-methylenetetrahydrofolate dehydrogenase/5,10-methenyltetrahydrofolate cyclohydrolase [Candidatus Saccharimonadales bacterium]
MKLLSGQEIAGFIKERQALEVRSLVQAGHVQPKLAIVLTIDHPVIEVYVKKKKRYGADIGVDVDIHQVNQDDVPALLKKLNKDASVHGIIVQLPLERSDETDDIVNLVAPDKDVDALGKKAEFDPATPMAILWLLAGYNVELQGKKILLIGRGRLVGAPLEKMLLTMGHDVTVIDRETKDLATETLQADVIITATGSPAILYPNMVKLGAVIVDAGVAGEGGKTVGDVAPEMFEREDLTITPAKGGVGPLTVCALFDNVIRSARRTASGRN